MTSFRVDERARMFPEDALYYSKKRVRTRGWGGSSSLREKRL